MQANLANRALPTTELLLLSTIAVRPGQLSSICVLDEKNTCVGEVLVLCGQLHASTAPCMSQSHWPEATASASMGHAYGMACKATSTPF